MATMEPPKRPRSGYFIFVAENRTTFRNENPGASVGELGKIAGEKWKTLEATEKQKYENLVQTEKQNYQLALETYQQYLQNHPELHNGIVTPEKSKNRSSLNDNTDTENDDPDDEEEDESSITVTSIPLARMKRLLTIDKDVKSMGKEALFLITAATEMFAQMLAQECAEVATENKRKTINNIDLAYAVARIPTFFFLKDDFPRPTAEQLQAAKAARLQAMLERKKATEETKETNGMDEDISGDNSVKKHTTKTVEGSSTSTDLITTDNTVQSIIPPKPKMDILAQITRAAALAPALPKPIVTSSDNQENIHGIEGGSSKPIGTATKKDGKTNGKGKSLPPVSALDRFVLRLETAEEARATWDASFAISEKNRPLTSMTTATTKASKDNKTNKNKNTKTKGKKRVQKVYDANGNVIEIEDDNDMNDNDDGNAEEMDEEMERQKREAAEEDGDIDLGFIRKNYDRKGRKTKKPSSRQRALSAGKSTKKKGKTVSLAYDDEEDMNEQTDQTDDAVSDNDNEEEAEDEQRQKRTVSLFSRTKVNAKSASSHAKPTVREEINLINDNDDEDEAIEIYNDDDGVRKGIKPQSYVYEGIEDIDKEGNNDGTANNDDEEDDEIDEFSQEVPPTPSKVLPRTTTNKTSITSVSNSNAGTSLSSSSSSSSSSSTVTNKRKLSI